MDRAECAAVVRIFCTDVCVHARAHIQRIEDLLTVLHVVVLRVRVVSVVGRGHLLLLRVHFLQLKYTFGFKDTNVRQM
jgi:hypothetical protein